MKRTIVHALAVLPVLAYSSCLTLGDGDPKEMSGEELVWPVVGDAVVSGVLFGLVNPFLGGAMMFVVPMVDFRVAAGVWAWDEGASE